MKILLKQKSLEQYVVRINAKKEDEESSPLQKTTRKVLAILTHQQIQLVHPNSANVAKKDIKDKLAQIYKVSTDLVAVYGLKTLYGGGKSQGWALIYDSLEARKKYDLVHLLKRDGFVGKRDKSRKQRKEIKGRQKKVRGTAKAKAVTGGKKK